MKYPTTHGIRVGLAVACIAACTVAADAPVLARMEGTQPPALLTNALYARLDDGAGSSYCLVIAPGDTPDLPQV